MSLSEGWRRFLDRLAGRSSSAEDERLVALFYNRVELKKELHALDDERYRLLDRLKLQESATQRAEEQMSSLEGFLGRPEEAIKCIAYFQLRAVWRAGSRRIETFAGELSRQQKDRERKQQLAEFERRQRGRVDALEREIVDANLQRDQLLAEQKLAEQRHASLRGFWNYFKRRALSEQIEERSVRIDEATAVLRELADRRRAIADEPPPEYSGLSSDGKRAVNLAIIAAAESLYDRYAAGNIAYLARQSSMQRVYEAQYGSNEQCQLLIQSATRVLADLERMQEDLQDIKIRTDRLRSGAVYRNDADTVPVVECINPSPGNARRPATANVLLEEFWELYKVLER
jgi:hypothetical protein